LSIAEKSSPAIALLVHSDNDSKRVRVFIV
jgi:hypothetical protein